jgi:hypothetical protein
MKAVIDPDVEAVAKFVDRNIPASKRVGVTNKLAEITSLLWGHHETEDVKGMRLTVSFDDGEDPKPT